MNNPAYRIGAILYGLVVGFFGVNHFLYGAKMTGLIPSYLPGAIVWVYISGGALVLAAIAIIINVQSKLAGFLLFLLLIIIISVIHIPAFLHAPDEATKMTFMTSILKDIAMAAAALMAAGKGR